MNGFIKGWPAIFAITGHENNKIMERLKSVSYTHLDVYKRQIENIPHGKLDASLCFDHLL